MAAKYLYSHTYIILIIECLLGGGLLLDVQEHVLSGGHGLMVQGYYPVIKALAKDIDIRLNHRYICITFE